MKRKLVLASFFILLSLGIWGFYYAMPRMFIDTKNTGFHRPKVENTEYINIKTFDNLNLEAFIIEPKKPVKATIILVHGLRACKEFYARRASEFSNYGYRVIAPDLRAHGNSEGTYCTFGVKEKEDIKSLVNYISERYPNEQIGIWGQSLGGAVSLQAMAVEPRLKFGIVESTFANFTDVGRDYLERYFGFRSESLSGFIESRVRAIGDFEPEMASPFKACKQITQPVLMVHGEQDANIKFKYGRQNFSALKSEKKRFISVPDGTHSNIWSLGMGDYSREVDEFICKSVGVPIFERSRLGVHK